MNPEISVILPFFNAEKTLESAIKSILDQTYKNFELLLVDNNSMDNSSAIAKKLAHSDSRIRLFKEAQNGVAHAMNCGLKNARGNYIARMDADDVSLPERLKKQICFLHENPEIDFTGTDVVYVPHNENTEGFKRFVNWVNTFHSLEDISLNRFVEIPIVNPTILFKKEIYKKYGGCVDGNFPEDYEMQLRFLQEGVKMAKLNEPLLEWHDSSTRLTRTDDRYTTEAFITTKALYFKTWSEKFNPFHPNIWVWGAGRKTRQRSRYLANEGLVIDGFIDVVYSKTTQKPTIHYSDIPKPGKIFIVPMVASWGARDLIKDFLMKAEYKEGKDFILLG